MEGVDALFRLGVDGVRQSSAYGNVAGRSFLGELAEILACKGFFFFLYYELRDQCL